MAAAASPAPVHAEEPKLLWRTKLGGGNSNIFYYHPYLGKISNLTNIFHMGWFNHQPEKQEPTVSSKWLDYLGIIAKRYTNHTYIHPARHIRLWYLGGVIYFTTNWGAKEPHNLPNHRVEWQFSIHFTCVMIFVGKNSLYIGALIQVGDTWHECNLSIYRTLGLCQNQGPWNWVVFC